MSKLSMFDVMSAVDEDAREHFRPHKKKVRVQHTSPNGPVIRITEDGHPVTVYASHVDHNAWDQASKFASLPFVHPKGMALMPDVHVGKDVPVGSVLPTVGAIVPAAVGVDIGCGMMACRLSLHANQLPDNLRRLRLEIEKAVPMGAGGRHKHISTDVAQAWQSLEAGHDWIGEKNSKAVRPKAWEQLGTLGSGNHFIEICLDESQRVWVLLHSGSRGAGSAVGEFFIQRALESVRKNGKSMHGLGWFEDTDPLFDDYIKSLDWAQNFASVNRHVMMNRVIDVIRSQVKEDIVVTEESVSCHHNYVAREQFDGADVWITRKGAVRARKGELGIIPGAMGQETFIVEGKGEDKSWCSCAHGAGRVMSRTAATKRFTGKEMKEALKGVECRKDRGVIDEIPMAYKPLRAVMKEQSDLVKVVHTLKAIICSKGV